MALNKQERDLLDRAYECLNRLTGLPPENPASINQVSTGLRLCAAVSRDVMYALFNIKIRDYAEAGEHLDAAERAISQGASR